MTDQYGVLAALLDQLAAGYPAQLAVIVGRRGSSPRSVGAMLLLQQDAAACGTVGGGALEYEVLQELHQIRQGRAAGLRQFSLLPEQDGMPCGGTVLILMAPVFPGDAVVFREVVQLLDQGSQVQLFARLTEHGEVSWGLTAATVTAQEFSILLQPVPQLLICGAGHIAQALAPMALAAGCQVMVMDDRPDYLAEHPFNRDVQVCPVSCFKDCLSTVTLTVNSFLLIATYGHQHDRLLLEQALATEVRYIGIVGSRRKRDELFALLRGSGISDADLARVYCPVGLEIGAETPAEIAVSILAEIIKVRRERA